MGSAQAFSVPFISTQPRRGARRDRLREWAWPLHPWLSSLPGAWGASSFQPGAPLGHRNVTMTCCRPTAHITSVTFLGWSGSTGRIWVGAGVLGYRCDGLCIWDSVGVPTLPSQRGVQKQARGLGNPCTVIRPVLRGFAIREDRRWGGRIPAIWEGLRGIRCDLVSRLQAPL